ncbi:TPA: hypothetical protein DCL30_01730 [Candidatus Peribacteria bacterium]|nr:hypothetical protein [Candidatus Peribacteria bacterium]HAS34472.1 hypothetical protein [Candidatus Peribacteria bacterium]
MGNRLPRQPAQEPTGPEKPCCTNFTAEISLGLSALPSNVSELETHQQEFKRRMGDRMTQLEREFPGAIRKTVPGLGTIEVIGSQETIDAIVTKTGGRILRLDHHGNDTDQEVPPPVQGPERAAA